jgi:hypothetical protein
MKPLISIRGVKADYCPEDTIELLASNARDYYFYGAKDPVYPQGFTNPVSVPVGANTSFNVLVRYANGCASRSDIIHLQKPGSKK